MHRLSLRRLLLGAPLATKDLPHQTVSKTVGLAVFASDALSSTAYAIQEMLIILALAGTGAAILGWSIPIAIAISLLLVILTISYRQTIYAYPGGGGAYIVARDNLGELPAQIAGAALLTDYVLTVAVSISSGVENITSGFQGLIPYRVELTVGAILFMMLVNLRGVKESGRIFAVPTYFFLGMMFLTLIVGSIRLVVGDLGTVQDVEPMYHQTFQSVTLFLILRAFSSGCTALTGVEAISNGITAFRRPSSHNAAITLIWMSGIMIVLLLGLTILAHQIAAMPSEVETVFSQIGRVVFGEGHILYYALLAGTALVLLMAANTSFADFPRLAALHAGDGFLPHQLTYRGGRLVFSWGIMGLALVASALVIATQAKVTRLIPLYAIGVFLSFTMSQTGMVVRLRKIGRLKPGEEIQGRETVMKYDPRWRMKAVISALGAVCTAMVVIIFAVTKFVDGAWFVCVLIPALVYGFFRIHFHYRDVAKALKWKGARPEAITRPVQTLILVDAVHVETARLVNFAKSLGHPWKAVHIGINPQRAAEAEKEWNERIGEGELVVIPSPFRRLAEPLKEYISDLQQTMPEGYVHVIMGHLVMDTFWEQALHQNSAYIFNLALSRMERVVVTSVPYQIRRKKNGQNGNGHPATPPVAPPPPESPQAPPAAAGDVAEKPE